MVEMNYLTTQELEAGLDLIRLSPKDQGILELIVRRPHIDEREVLKEGELNLVKGLAGDNWISRINPKRLSDPAHLDTQITIMNARMIALLCQDRNRWPLAGDQLYADLDLSEENIPPGTQLAIGAAIVQVSGIPHTGCKKFVSRFGMDAMLFVNSPVGRELHLRGINTRVVKPGTIHPGDPIIKLR